MKLWATCRLSPDARPWRMVGSKDFDLGLKRKRIDDRPSPRFQSDCKRISALSILPALWFSSSRTNVASNASGPCSVRYGDGVSIFCLFSKDSHVKNRTSLLAGPWSSAICQTSSSGSRGGVSMTMLDSSRLSRSGKGPNLNVSRSGSRSSCSRSCLGAYGWSKRMAATRAGQQDASPWRV